MSFFINTNVGNNAVVVHVKGDLDVYTAPELKEVLAQGSLPGCRLVLDLSEVDFIDSTALGVLVGALEVTQSNGGDFRLVVDDPFLLKIFRITGFDGLFSIFSQVADALSEN